MMNAPLTLTTLSLFLLLAPYGARAASPDALPQTQSLSWADADLSTRLMDGAHQFVERKIAQAAAKRGRYWTRDFSSAAAYAKSVHPNRERWREIIGAVDAREPAAMERYGDDLRPALAAETAHYRVFQVRWPVLEGLWGSGLLVQPKRPAVARVVVVPDADQTPEQLLGLSPGIAPGAQVARRLAENGCEVIIPVTISRAKLRTEDPQLRATDQTYREWIYRQAFHLGRHVIGYEVQTVLAAVDWFAAQPGAVKIGVCGHVEGGLVALHAAALDPRIDAALVSGYFDSRQRVWAEPIYRNVWSRLREFGDAELAALVLPRALVIEHSPVPVVTGHKGELRTPELARVSAEVARIETGPRFARPVFVHGEGGRTLGPFADQSVSAFAGGLGMSPPAPATAEEPREQRRNFDPAARHQRYFTEMEGHVQRLLQRSEHVRDQAFLYRVMPELADSKWSTAPRYPTHAPEEFIAGAKPYRERFWTEAMGRFDEPLLPFNARTRKVAESAQWTAYDVVLDVYPELFAWGLLVLPSFRKTWRPASVGRWSSSSTGATDCPAICSTATRLTTATSPPRWPSAASSPLRPTISIAARTATAGSTARRTP